MVSREMLTLFGSGLKQSLADLNNFSTTMTRRLDETYYSVLERMSTLQNTIVALRDLAQSSHAICETFDKDARDLENDIIRQLSAAGQFEEQQRRISTLQSRIRDGRDRIQALSSRVDVVQQRVEKWERADRAWQEKTRKRLKIIWSASTVVVLVVIAVVIGLDYAGVQPDPEGRWATSWSSSMSPNIPPWLNNSGVPDEESGRKMLWKAPQGDGEQLRAFDEL